LLALLMISFWPSMVGYRPSSKPSTIWKTCRGFKSLQGRDFSAISYGLIPLMMIVVLAHRSSLKMMCVGAAISLERRRQTHFYRKISFYLFLERTRHNSMDIRCTSGMEPKSSQQWSPFFLLLTTVMCTITRAQ
jgi:hypothetical protein